MEGCYVVTGGSRGVGLEICRILLGFDLPVVSLSRTIPPIDHPRHVWVDCDISDPARVAEAVPAIRSVCLDSGIQGIVFNAAGALYGDCLEMPEDAVEAMFRANVLGPTALLKGLRGLMLPRAELLYISTSASRIPAPMMGHYAATKLAFESIVQTAAMENGWQAHILRPAEIETTFAETSGVPAEADAGVKKLSPVKVAQAGVSLFGTTKAFRNVGLRAQILDAVIRVWPSLLLQRKKRLKRD
jgi:3-oxoacyl-[acyl-carrier protein] reductase